MKSIIPLAVAMVLVVACETSTKVPEVPPHSPIPNELEPLEPEARGRSHFSAGEKLDRSCATDLLRYCSAKERFYEAVKDYSGLERVDNRSLGRIGRTDGERKDENGDWRSRPNLWKLVDRPSCMLGRGFFQYPMFFSESFPESDAAVDRLEICFGDAGVGVPRVHGAIMERSYRYSGEPTGREWEFFDLPEALQKIVCTNWRDDDHKFVVTFQIQRFKDTQSQQSICPSFDRRNSFGREKSESEPYIREVSAICRGIFKTSESLAQVEICSDFFLRYPSKANTKQIIRFLHSSAAKGESYLRPLTFMALGEAARRGDEAASRFLQSAVDFEFWSGPTAKVGEADHSSPVIDFPVTFEESEVRNWPFLEQQRFAWKKMATFEQGVSTRDRLINARIQGTLIGLAYARLETNWEKTNSLIANSDFIHRLIPSTYDVLLKVNAIAFTDREDRAIKARFDALGRKRGNPRRLLEDMKLQPPLSRHSFYHDDLEQYINGEKHRVIYGKANVAAALDRGGSTGFPRFKDLTPGHLTYDPVVVAQKLNRMAALIGDMYPWHAQRVAWRLAEDAPMHFETDDELQGLINVMTAPIRARKKFEKIGLSHYAFFDLNRTVATYNLLAAWVDDPCPKDGTLPFPVIWDSPGLSRQHVESILKDEACHIMR